MIYLYDPLKKACPFYPDMPQTVDKVRGAAPDFSISKNCANPYIYWLYCPFYGIINVSFLRR